MRDKHPGDRHETEREPDATPGRTLDRRRFLQVAGATVAAVGGTLGTAAAASAAPSHTADALRSFFLNSITIAGDDRGR